MDAAVLLLALFRGTLIDTTRNNTTTVIRLTKGGAVSIDEP